MESLTSEERRFFEMIKSTGTKKISINLSEETIDKIDELARIFRITRTLAIESVMRTGLGPYLTMIEKANKKIRSSKEYNNQEKTRKLNLMRDNLAKFREKWKV